MQWISEKLSEDNTALYLKVDESALTEFNIDYGAFEFHEANNMLIAIPSVAHICTTAVKEFLENYQQKQGIVSMIPVSIVHTETAFYFGMLLVYGELSNSDEPDMERCNYVLKNVEKLSKSDDFKLESENDIPALNNNAIADEVKKTEFSYTENLFNIHNKKVSRVFKFTTFSSVCEFSKKHHKVIKDSQLIKYGNEYYLYCSFSSALFLISLCDDNYVVFKPIQCGFVREGEIIVKRKAVEILKDY